MDAGQLTGAIFIDFRKAFDTIDHKILLDKLQMFGIYDSEHRWMTDYLTNRTQSVFVRGVLSCPQQVTSGVPQGSILGPLLFSMYVTDLPNSLRAANVLMYADDTVIYYAASEANQLERVLNAELKLLHDWSTMNELFIHPKKTEYVIFGTAVKRNQINSDNLSGVYLGDQVLNCRPFYKYLGVYLDQTLSFKEHVTRLVNKVSRQLGLLSRVRNSLTVHAAERIFTAMILPKLDYCDFVWNNLAASRYNALERLQTRAARIILKESSLSHEHLLRQLSWMSLKARSNMHIVTFVFKCVRNNAPDLFMDYFVKTSHNYSTRRNGLDILVPKVSTETAKKGCYYLGAQVFNILPSRMKETESLLIFKTIINDFLVNVQIIYKYCIYIVFYFLFFTTYIVIFLGLL